jgi:2-octaprenyl-6-methoxyphenol hydroxylase
MNSVKKGPKQTPGDELESEGPGAPACDALIVGGGPVGLALACALADALAPAGRIGVVDPAAPAAAPPDARASAVSAGSKRLLDALGVWDALAPDAEPVVAVDITDASLGDVFRPVLISYDNTVEGGEHATYVVENEKLLAALQHGVARRPGVVRIGGAVENWHVAGDRGVIGLDDGRMLHAPLIVAADGRTSLLREAAGIAVVGWTYGQTGIVAAVAHAKPHRSRAVQNFLPAGPFAILPLRGNRSCITWTEEESEARRILALDDAGFLAEVQSRFGYRLGEIALAGGRGAWPLAMHLARALVAERLALVGDAAHLVHPIAGQGLNLGLRDVAALTEVVADAARLGLDIGSGVVLERYARWRRTDAAMSAAAFDALNRLFSNDSTLLRTARDAGLQLVDRMPGLKQLIVAEAAGLTGEVPKLLRGEPV